MKGDMKKKIKCKTCCAYAMSSIWYELGFLMNRRPSQQPTTYYLISRICICILPPDFHWCLTSKTPLACIFCTLGSIICTKYNTLSKYDELIIYGLFVLFVCSWLPFDFIKLEMVHEKLFIIIFSCHCFNLSTRICIIMICLLPSPMVKCIVSYFCFLCLVQWSEACQFL